MNKLILTGALSAALVLGVVGCGNSNSSNTTPPTTTKVQTNTTSSNPSGNPALTGANATGSTGSKTVGSNTTGTSSGNPLLQGNTTSVGSSGSGGVSSGSQPGVTTSQPLPGPSGADMQKVLTAVFQNPQVLQILVDPNNKGKKPGFVFSQQNGNTVAVNGQWTGQLTLDNKPVANVAVSAQDFSVKSVTLIH